MRREWWKEDLICLLKGEEAWEEPALAALLRKEDGRLFG